MTIDSCHRRSLSENLHERVLQFGEARLRHWGERTAEPFDELALAIANYQREFSAVGSSLSAKTIAFETISQVPAVPTEVFRRTRVATHGRSEDAALFLTSGTTGGRGQHPFRSLQTYAQLTVAWGRQGLQLPKGPLTVIALASPFAPERSSSLSFMMAEFMAQFDGRALSDGARPFDVDESGRWLLAGDGVDLAGLQRAIECALRREEPLLLLATSFALVWLLDQLQGKKVPLPAGSVVMHTGGFKGRTRSVAPEVLRSDICRVLGVAPEQIKSEYGMTELSSQLYDRGQGPIGSRGGHVYRSPPWLRVEAVNPTTLLPVAKGQVGWARFTDLCNIDSALIVLTQDRIRLGEGGIELLGRVASVTVRGCSVAVEQLRAFPQKAEMPSSSSGDLGKSGEPTAGAAPGVRLLKLQVAVRSLVAVGSASRERLIFELQRESGLSAAGVIRGLNECLELEPSAAELARLRESAEPCARAHVVLPGRVFAAAYRAIALALLSSASVCVKASRRQLVFARAIAKRIPGLFQLVEQLEVRSGDHLWVYGSDETLEALRGQMPAGVHWHAHGTGFGVAAVRECDVLPGNAHTQSVVEAIAGDVALFDQQGCLSPRLVIFEGDESQAAAFSEKLACALASEALRTPKGRTRLEDQSQAQWARSSALALGKVYSAGPGWVSCPRRSEILPQPEDIPPPERLLEVRSVACLQSELKRLAPWLTAVGCSSQSVEHEVLQWLPNARVSEVGAMQRPPFDGPVDQRPESVQHARANTQ